MQYTFTTLTPEDFEALVSDLLSEEWGTILESFKPGKDQGIDLRNAREPKGGGGTIVQCKRYGPHQFNNLVANVKEEAKKLRILQPKRYVLVTSVPLSPGNKNKLLALLSPWCMNSGDIYGGSEVNQLLRSRPYIERRHFKLWISSTGVLEQILNARVFTVTDDTLEAYEAHVGKLVVHDGLTRAWQLLEEHHHAVIAGNPGVGKTTLAQMLLCQYINNGFQPIWVTSNIDDAWSLITASKDKTQKLAIVYDDFLGSYHYDTDRFGKNEDVSLMQLIRKVARSENLRFILTTREYILTEAKRRHRVFDDRARELQKCVVSIEDYTLGQRARMLYNHLYYSDLPPSRLRALIVAKAYDKIITNVHCNPRVVEYISINAHNKTKSDEDFLNYVEQEFEDPSRLWDRPYRDEISPLARTILHVLWSFGGRVRIEELMRFVEKVHVRDTHPFSFEFESAMKQLEGNFTLTIASFSTGESAAIRNVTFQNPSIREFIERTLKKYPDTIESVIGYVNEMQQARVFFRFLQGLDQSLADTKRLWRLLREAIRIHGTNSAPVIADEITDSGDRTTQRQSSDDYVTDTLSLLRIEAATNINDERTSALKERVLTMRGWSRLSQGLIYGHDAIPSIVALHDWITQDSGWALNEKFKATRALRIFFLQFLESEDGAMISLNDINGLLQSLNRYQPPLARYFQSRMAAAIGENLWDITGHIDDSSDLFDVADTLERIGKTLGVDFSWKASSIRERADEIASKETRPVRSRLSAPSDDLKQNDYRDFDELFQSLLEQ